ncbi:unnamed protein product [Calypogeia fissa]
MAKRIRFCSGRNYSTTMTRGC